MIISMMGVAHHAKLGDFVFELVDPKGSFRVWIVRRSGKVLLGEIWTHDHGYAFTMDKHLNLPRAVIQATTIEKCVEMAIEHWRRTEDARETADITIEEPVEAVGG